MEIGITSFGELTDRSVTPEQRMKDLIEEIVLADQVGLDVYGLGEHHRQDFVVSNPAVVLAAAASRTERIRLSSAVSVLSSEDPVRLFQAFAELDLISGGRAEVMAGRGSFTESFPLFGLDLEQYDELFSEKLELLLALRAHERVTWSGKHRPALHDQPVFPRPVQDPLPVWIAVGGTPNSVARAGVLGLPLALAIIGGEPARFAPFVDLYKRALEHGEQPLDTPIAVHAHGFVSDTEQHAVRDFYPAYAQVMTQLGRERGWPPMSQQGFDAMRRPEGSLVIGDPEQVTEKVIGLQETLSLDRFMLHPSVGTMPHASVMKAIELLGTDVAPAVRAEVARRTAPAPA